MKIENPVIFYDGVCGLCDRSVQFILRNDYRKRFQFATLQSDYAKRVLGEQLQFDSFVFYYRGKARYRSAGALFMFWHLGGLWSLFFIFMLIPGFLRDAVYNWVARNRYRWFGKLESCRIPLPEERERFIDQV
ncbi:MAG: DCC1-like thiol-disulfide oxidoreductase family protein [Bacteroidia bacterium]|jgi:predicted DCC family thiol-disulfide oxidoreductase YuxK